MAPNRKHFTLLCESFDVRDLQVVHPKAAPQQLLRQQQQQQQPQGSSDSYWEWVSPDVEEEPTAVEEKPIDLFSADHIVSKLVAAASPSSNTTGTEPAAAAVTLASSDDYWAEQDFASSPEEGISCPQHVAASPDYWQWGQEPTESDDYWRPEQQHPNKNKSSNATPDAAAGDYYWNESPTAIEEEELQGFRQLLTEPPTESASYWNWKTPTAVRQRAVICA